MWKTLSIIILIFGTVLCAPKPGLGRSKIVGGETASLGAFPYQVSIELNGYHWCGGSIIADDLILTAAHCTVDMERGEDDITVRAGTNSREVGGQVVDVEDWVQHQSYNAENVNNDIALMKLKRPLKFNKYVRSIRLVDNDKYLQKSKPLGTVSGWGKTHENHTYISEDLQYASIPVLPKEKCKELLGENFSPDNMICAGLKEGKVDACQSDSGGPLVVNRKLVGVVSFGIGCARPGTPGVYADVLALKSWVEDSKKILKKSSG